MKREKDYGTTFKFEGTDLDEAYKRYKNPAIITTYS